MLLVNMGWYNQLNLLCKVCFSFWTDSDFHRWMTDKDSAESQCLFPSCVEFLTLVFLSVILFVAVKKKEKRSKVGEDGRGKRNAIRLHEAYTVETVVVADSDMVQYHGAEAAQRFLLTVMNMVRIPDTNRALWLTCHLFYLWWINQVVKNKKLS